MENHTGNGKKNGNGPIYSKQTKGAEDYDFGQYVVSLNDMLQLHVAAVTDVGFKRKREALEELRKEKPETGSLSQEERDKLTQANEDNFAVRNGLLILADGMGGHEAGEIASELACNTFIENISSVLESSSGNASRDFPSFLLDAQKSLFQYAQQNPNAEGLGCALIAAQFQPDATVAYVNVGDTRLYVWDSTKPEGTTPGFSLEQMTMDHSAIWKLLDVWEEYQTGDQRMKERARIDTRKNILYNAVGGPGLDINFIMQQQRSVKPGEVYLLCSDGLWDELSDKQINDILRWAYQQYPKNDFEVANALVNAAKAVGGNDNITVILARVAPTEKALYKEGFHAWKRKDKNALADIIEQNPEVFAAPKTGEAYLFSGIYEEQISQNKEGAYANYKAAWKQLKRKESFFGMIGELMQDSPLRQALSGYLRLGWQQRKKKKVQHYEAQQLGTTDPEEMQTEETEELPLDAMEPLEDARALSPPLAYKIVVTVEEVPDAPVIPSPMSIPASLESRLDTVVPEDTKQRDEILALLATVQQKYKDIVKAANDQGLELFRGYDENILDAPAYKAFLAFETVINIVPGLEEALIVQWDHLIKKADESGHEEVFKALFNHLHDGTYDKEKIAKEVFLGYYEDAGAEFYASGDSISALKKLNLDELDGGAKSYKGGEGAVRLLTAEILFAQEKNEEARVELGKVLQSADFSDSRYKATRQDAEEKWKEYFPDEPVPQQVVDGNGKKKNGHPSSIAEEGERLYAFGKNAYDSSSYEQAEKASRAVLALDATHQGAQELLGAIALETTYLTFLSMHPPVPATEDHGETIARRHQIIYTALEAAKAAAERDADKKQTRIRELEGTIAVFERQDAERKYTEHEVEEKCTNARADALDERRREYEPQIETLKATKAELLEQIANAKEVTPQELERIVEERLRRKLGEETYTKQQVDETVAAVRAAALAEAEQQYAPQIAAEKERYQALEAKVKKEKPSLVSQALNIISWAHLLYMGISGVKKYLTAEKEKAGGVAEPETAQIQPHSAGQQYQNPERQALHAPHKKSYAALFDKRE